MIDHAAVIRARRAQSNAAIAARDAARVVALMLDDVTVAVAGGVQLDGREASRIAFAEQFVDRTFQGYVRDAHTVTLHDPPLQATERGRWVGRWGGGSRREEMRGSYIAQWRHTEMGWFLQSESFVTDGVSTGGA